MSDPACKVCGALPGDLHACIETVSDRPSEHAAITDAVFEAAAEDGLKSGAPSIHWLRTLATRLWHRGVRAVAAGAGDPSMTPIEWQAVMDALLFTENHAAIVSDAHGRAHVKVDAFLDALAVRDAPRDCIQHVNCGGGQHDPTCPRSRPSGAP